MLPGLVRRRAAEAELFLAGPANDVAVSRATVTPPEGKPLSRSSSAAAAAVTVAAGGAAAAARGHGSLIIGLVLLVAAVAAAAWIIRQRWRIAKEEGV